MKKKNNRTDSCSGHTAGPFGVREREARGKAPGDTDSDRCAEGGQVYDACAVNAKADRAAARLHSQHRERDNT